MSESLSSNLQVARRLDCYGKDELGYEYPALYRPERWWVVALIGEVKGDDEKYGALQREIIGECL